MAPRDPRLTALNKVDRTKATVARTRATYEAATAAHRAALAEAVRVGVTKVELARRTQTSEARIRASLSRGAQGF